MIHLSSYHSNGLPTVVWSNKVNLIGEKVYKPKIHFCEHCNKPILIYGRLIPCKHVFCFTCATLCLSQPQTNSSSSLSSATAQTPPIPGPSEPPPAPNRSPTMQNHSSTTVKGCHRCGGRALRVERNTLNSIFVCQIESCKRTYLSARDLQAHVTHRHSKNKPNNNNAGASSASLAAISSSPYISSSTLMHLNRQSSSSTTSGNYTSNPTADNNHNSPNNHHRRDRIPHHPQSIRDRDRDRYSRDRDSYQRERERERDSKEYHRQSLQRAAQWAEVSAQMLEKGLTR